MTTNKNILYNKSSLYTKPQNFLLMNQIFKKSDPPLQSIILDIKMGKIGLPDLQRPFIWSNIKVRDLIDSMYRGYPVGNLLFWKHPPDAASKTIGDNTKSHTPQLLIVDGQQRLTAIYAVFTGTSVVRKNKNSETIQIAFNPFLEIFEVSNAANKKDRWYYPNITLLFDNNANLFDIVGSYIDELSKVCELENEDITKIQSSFNKLSSLTSYPFTALELLESANEEQVGDVFVRINSKGVTLRQADYILTLMSVFWEDGRKQLENFQQQASTPSIELDSPFNYLFQPSPDQLLRVTVGVAFRRARLRHVYWILRGKDLETGDFSIESRENQFDKLKQAQNHVVNIKNWHSFINVINRAGFVSDKMISSQINLLYAYIFYLLGKTEFDIEENELGKLIGRWFFMTALTGRYTNSLETTMETDLGRLRNVSDKSEFTRVLNDIISTAITNDYWMITLPDNLATPNTSSPSNLCYYAALNILEAKVLFSNNPIFEKHSHRIFESHISNNRHHLFPKKYLQSIGINRRMYKNQIANFAIINSDIQDSPQNIIPEIEAKLESSEMKQMYYWHALPQKWYELSYDEFLIQRRKLMAQIIRDAYNILLKDDEKVATTKAVQDDISSLILEGESVTTEFKSTLRTNLETSKVDKRIENEVLKTIAGFLNRDGGTLIVGISDEGTPMGISKDRFLSEDKMSLHLVNLIRDRIGKSEMAYINSRFEDYKNERVLVVDCKPATKPVYVKDNDKQQFYIRGTGAATIELHGPDLVDYVQERFSS